MTTPLQEFQPIAEDIRWLRESWWLNAIALSGADIRRGSATLRKLLVQGELGLAWRACGFVREPTLVGPDAHRLAARQGLELRHAASLIVGGARLNDLDVSMVGVFRTKNPTTGIGPDADEGFAVTQTLIVRDVRRGPPTPSLIDGLVE